MSGTDLKSTRVPLHYQVYLDLSAALDEGRWKPGDRIPPERELAELYHCSLITMRRALDELAREKRLERMRGRGTFVLRPPLAIDLVSNQSFAELMRAHELDPQTKMINGRLEPADDAVAEALGVEPGASVYFIERLRIANGEPLFLERAHLPVDRFPGLLEADLAGQSLYGTLERNYGVRIAHARESVEPVLLRTHDARLLEQQVGRPALLFHGWAFDEEHRVVEFTRSLIRGDRTIFYLDRAIRPGPPPPTEVER